MTAADLDRRLAAIELVGFDVDGVFTDGRFYLSDDGVESKAFNTQDGYGIRRVLEAGIRVAVISGRRSGAVERRMAELGVTDLYLGCGDKVAAFGELRERYGLNSEHCAYVGDDLPDLPLLREAGVAIAVANAREELHHFCQWTTAAKGGHGAVREVCDRLLAARAAGPAA